MPRYLVVTTLQGEVETIIEASSEAEAIEEAEWNLHLPGPEYTWVSTADEIDEGEDDG